MRPGVKAAPWEIPPPPLLRKGGFSGLAPSLRPFIIIPIPIPIISQHPLPSSRIPYRHPASPAVIPHPPPSSRIPRRHSASPAVIPHPPPSSRIPRRHSASPIVIPAPTRHSGAGRNPEPRYIPACRDGRGVDSRFRGNDGMGGGNDGGFGGGNDGMGAGIDESAGRAIPGGRVE